MTTTLYTNHYSPDIGETGHATTRQSPHEGTPVGLKHARDRWSSAQLIVPDATDLTTGDIIRIMDLQSNARLRELFVSSDANWHTTATFNIGLYLKGDADDGAVVDEDLFAAADDWVNEVARVDVFDQATTLADWDRGKMLWELVNAVTASTYAKDPQVMYTIAATASADITVVNAAVEMLFEAHYNSGD